MRDSGDPPSGDAADTSLLAGPIEQLARSGEAAFVPLAARLLDPLQGLLGADTTLVLRGLQDLHHSVSDAQCRESLPAWLRWLGQTRDTGRRFQSDCQDAIGCRARVLERARRLAQHHQPQAAESGTDLDRLADAADRLGAAVAEAQQRLARLWERLMPQRPDPADPQSLGRLRALLAEADVQRALVERLDQACDSARDVVRLGRAVLAGRGELLGLLDGRFARSWDEWHARIQPLLQPGLQQAQLVTGARNATASRRGLLLALDQMRGLCTRLQIDEQALADALSQLRAHVATLLHDEAGPDTADPTATPDDPGG